MHEARPIGRSKMTALVINCIIGSAIFGVPSEAIRMVGAMSPLAMLGAGLLMGVIILPIAEVASQFSAVGGLYLYARTAFGSFVGLEVGWFWWLAIVGGGAANANLFLTYLAQFAPGATHGSSRVATLILLVTVPTVVNYLGVRQGVNLSVLFTFAKSLPLLLVIGLGVFRTPMAHHIAPALLPTASAAAWLKLLLILFYAFSGWEDALAPSGEVAQPRRTIPFGLVTGLLLCIFVYTLFQLVVFRTIGMSSTERPVVETASALLGSGAGSFVAVAVMLSTYGWLSGAFLNGPRFPVALAKHGDCPGSLGRLHPKFKTPSIGILLYGGAVLLLAVTGTFLWAIALTAGSLTIFYAITCAALIRLRRLQPHAKAFRVPFGPALSIIGIGISFTLLFEVEPRQLALMSITALLAAANWAWARGSRAKQREHYQTL